MKVSVTSIHLTLLTFLNHDKKMHLTEAVEAKVQQF